MINQPPKSKNANTATKHQLTYYIGGIAKYNVATYMSEEIAMAFKAN